MNARVPIQGLRLHGEPIPQPTERRTYVGEPLRRRTSVAFRESSHENKTLNVCGTENPQKIFQCHACECKFRGNLLTLMHGFLTSSKSTGGKLKSDEFQRVKKVLAGITQPVVSGKALADC